jgi:dihydrofolate reductase
MATEPLLTLIAARGANGVIGVDGALPWRLGSDLTAFKTRTMGKPAVMGRKTWESLPKALPGRPNLVIGRNHGFRPAGAFIFSDLEAALAAARAMALARGVNEVCVIGGGAIYAALISRADRLVLTDVDASPSGDAFFPAFDEADFREANRQTFLAGPRDDHDFVVRELERVAA